LKIDEAAAPSSSAIVLAWSHQSFTAPSSAHRRQFNQWFLTPFSSRVALIQALIPLGLKVVAEALEAEVTDLAGERYSRTGR